jgi:aerobic-type carbon monoxide dehydrogenase small subunit (CoxS/CutS family)
MPHTTFTLNGKPATVSYEPGMDFLEVLREQCEIVSPKNGCSPEGACGCCAVLVDGQPVFACLRQPEHMTGREVVTLEGVPPDMRRVLGEAFLLEGAVQCGFCIPGIVIRAAGLLQHNRTPNREEIAKSLDGHLCRCTGYARIIDAIQTAGETWLDHDHQQLPREEPRRHSYFGEDFGLARTTKNGKHGNGIGQSPSRYLGLDQALGAKPFVDDMRVPGMLHAAPVLSPHPRAKVLAIDASPALEMPGVERVFTATDVPGQRGTGLAIPDLPILIAVGEITCCVGDILALVVADTAFHARQAANRVQVEYEVYEPVTDPIAAMLRAICTRIRTCSTPRLFRAAMWTLRWPLPPTSSSKPSRPNRSNRHFLSPKPVLRSRREMV